jgi:excisionase family DNA binding protein
MFASAQIATSSFEKEPRKEQLAPARERNELLTVKEAAELLRVPVSWVYDRTRKRSLDRLPGIRLGKYWRFRQGEVLAWVDSQRERSNAT